MAITAKSVVSTVAESLQAGRTVGEGLCGSGRELELVLTYLTMNHDHEAYLKGLRESLGADVQVVGCSAQGVVGRSFVRERGYAAGALGLGGDAVQATTAMVEDIAADAWRKGEQLGRALLAGSSQAPKVVVLHYDALCGVDPEQLIQGLYHAVNCPIFGGAAAHSFDYFSLKETYQYFGDRVVARAAVAVALSGGLEVEIGSCHGSSPVGVEFEVTRVEGNVLYELDGRRASDVWEEICGSIAEKSNQSSALAIGVPTGNRPGDYQVRAAYFIDPQSGGVTLGPVIPKGTRIMLHHRTIEDVLEGARAMGRELMARIGNRTIRAVLGFECGARTQPFLGAEGTLSENLELQTMFGEEPAWLGMMPWGEIFPIVSAPTFHNYSYPLLVIAE